MELNFYKPQEIAPNIFQQLTKLIVSGEQVQEKGLDARLLGAELIALLMDEDVIVSTATLKKPSISYKEMVFEVAGVKEEKDKYLMELGYIVTHPNYEGRKFCQKVLSEFVPQIKNQNLFSTTRKEAMAHILAKHSFKQFGKAYKDGLLLLTLDAER